MHRDIDNALYARRAPALYVSAVPTDDGSRRYSFRLPIPPLWDDRPPGAWAVERRARKAYFTALDALRTGAISPDRAAKLARLIEEVKSTSARAGLEQLERVLAAVERGDQPMPVLPPPLRLREITATIPRSALVGHESIETRFAWTVEWLRARGYLTGMEEAMRWRVDSTSALRPVFVGAAD